MSHALILLLVVVSLSHRRTSEVDAIPAVSGRLDRAFAALGNSQHWPFDRRYRIKYIVESHLIN